MEGWRPVVLVKPAPMIQNEFGDLVPDPNENPVELGRSAMRVDPQPGAETVMADADVFVAGLVVYVVRADDGLADLSTSWELRDVTEGGRAFEILGRALSSVPTGERRWRISCREKIVA